jgi:hypothetical protein
MNGLPAALPTAMPFDMGYLPPPDPDDDAYQPWPDDPLPWPPRVSTCDDDAMKPLIAHDLPGATGLGFREWPYGDSTLPDRRCQEPIPIPSPPERPRWAPRARHFILMRRAGLKNPQIAEGAGVPIHIVVDAFAKARRAGWEVPPSPWP